MKLLTKSKLMLIRGTLICMFIAAKRGDSKQIVHLISVLFCTIFGNNEDDFYEFKEEIITWLKMNG